MNANVLAMVSQNVQDAAVLTSQCQKGQNVSEKGMESSFAKALSKAADEKPIVGKNKAAERNASDDERPKDDPASENIGLMPLGVVTNNQQTKAEEAGKGEGVQILNAAPVSSNTALSATGFNTLVKVSTSENVKILDDSQAPSATVGLTEVQQNQKVLQEQLKASMVISVSDNSNSQSETNAENAGLPIAQNSLTVDKKEPLNVSIQTEKNMLPEMASEENSCAAAMGTKISEDTHKVQYSAYGMKIIPGNKNGGITPISAENQPLMQASDAVEAIMQDKPSLAHTKTADTLTGIEQFNNELENQSGNKPETAAEQGVIQTAIVEPVKKSSKEYQNIKQDAKQEVVRGDNSDTILDVTNNEANIQPDAKKNNSVDVLQSAFAKQTKFSEVNIAAKELSQKTHTDKTDLSQTLTTQSPSSSQIQLQKTDTSLTFNAVQTATGQPIADKYEVVSQIIEHAKLINRTNNSEMVIQLKPEHLGELTLKVSVDNGAITTTFHSNNPDVRSVIEASLNQLRQEMSNQGLKVDYVGVYAGLSQFSSQQQRENQQQPAYKFQNKKQVTEFAGAMDLVAQPEAVDSLGGVDYRV